MVKYRGRADIIADIVNAANTGSKKTRIMYAANLSHMLLEKYLGEAIMIGFLRLNNDFYEATEKGRTFLEKYTEFSSRYTRIERELQGMRFEREILERMCETVGEDNHKPIVMRRR